MIKYDYNQFVEELNSGKIKEVYFSVKNYGHYRNCYVKRYPDTFRNGDKFMKIEVCLTTDGSEKAYFVDTFRDDNKLFKMKGIGAFTFKDIWSRIQINKIVYNTPACGDE